MLLLRMDVEKSEQPRLNKTNNQLFTTGAGMKKYDAEKISMNLVFLGENTINTELLVHKLIDKGLINKGDEKRIFQLPAYDVSMEVYLTVIRKGPHAFTVLLDCLNESGNDIVLERLNPQTDFQEIGLAFRRHWPFTCLLIVTNICGIFYWLHRLQTLLFSQK